jgi:hypothetical protein
MFLIHEEPFLSVKRAGYEKKQCARFAFSIDYVPQLTPEATSYLDYIR